MMLIVLLALLISSSLQFQLSFFFCSNTYPIFATLKAVFRVYQMELNGILHSTYTTIVHPENSYNSFRCLMNEQ